MRATPPPRAPPAPARRRVPAGAALFALGDLAYAAAHAHDARVALLVLARAAAAADECAPFACGIDGCAVEFCALQAYERHVSSEHGAHRCSACGRGFVSERLVSMHAQEAHDALFALLAARRPMYACLLAACSGVFRTARGRQRHRVDAPLFPRSFRFDGGAPAATAAAAVAAAKASAVAGGRDAVPLTEGREGLLPEEEGEGERATAASREDEGAIAAAPRAAAPAAAAMTVEDEGAAAARRRVAAAGGGGGSGAPPRTGRGGGGRRPPPPPCKFFGSSPGCTYGAACRFLHNSPGAATAAASTDGGDSAGDTAMSSLADSLACRLRVGPVPEEISFGGRRGGGRGGARPLGRR
jgi:hypothetical protein